MTTILDGIKPLWPRLSDYITWLSKHEDDIYARYIMGDANADLIVHIVAEKNIMRDTLAASCLIVVVERYISAYHPEIAVIEEIKS